MYEIRRFSRTLTTELSIPTPSGFNPLSLFSGGAQGVWLDPSDSAVCFQDAARTTPAANGDPVGGITDKSGNGNNASQATAGERPSRIQSGALWYFLGDGTDDSIASSYVIAQPWYRISAIRVVPSPSTGDQLFGGSGANSGALYCSDNAGTPDWTMFAGSDGPLTELVNDTDYVITEYFNGASSIIRRNGVQQGGSVDPGATAPGGVTLFESSLGSGSVNARCYGLIVTSKALSGSEIDSAEEYMAAKAGISL